MVEKVRWCTETTEWRPRSESCDRQGRQEPVRARVFFWGRERTCVKELVLERRAFGKHRRGKREVGIPGWHNQHKQKHRGEKNPEAQSWESLKWQPAGDIVWGGNLCFGAHTLRVDGENHWVSGGSLRCCLHGLVWCPEQIHEGENLECPHCIDEEKQNQKAKTCPSLYN